MLRYTAWVVPARGVRQAGTGVLVDRSRKLVLTLANVVGSETLVKVVFPSQRDGKVVGQRDGYLRDLSLQVPARVVHKEPRNGLAVLELDFVPEGLEEVNWAMESPQPGEPVFALGQPVWSTELWVFQTGHVRQIYQRRLAQKNPILEAQVIEVQVPYNQGDNGAPLVNERGELVGIVEGTPPKTQLLTFAIAAREAREVVDRGREVAIKLGPRDLAPTLVEIVGLNVRRPDRVLADQLDLPPEKGLLIDSVRADSLGAKLGVQATDVLFEIDGQPVSSNPADLGKVLALLKTEMPMEVVVLRKSRPLVLKGLEIPVVRIDKPGK
jgi:S1-C subfamily serine protease